MADLYLVWRQILLNGVQCDRSIRFHISALVHLFVVVEVVVRGHLGTVCQWDAGQGMGAC